VKKLYVAWIKINDTLPWIEIEGTYKTKNEARKAAKETIKRIKIKIAYIPNKEKPAKVLAPVKAGIRTR
jgi:hypothetical protein